MATFSDPPYFAGDTGTLGQVVLPSTTLNVASTLKTVAVGKKVTYYATTEFLRKSFR